MVEFVSYNGEYPNLCRGLLVLLIDGEKVELDCCLISGGGCYFDKDWESFIDFGAWDIELPDELMKYKKEILECVNENIEYGCCGGCI